MRTVLFALHAVLVVVPLHAQTEPTAPLVLTLPASTRALGLGNAYVLVGRDSEALFAHPGVLDQARGSAIAVQRYGSTSTLGVISTAREWASGGLAFGAQVLVYHPQTVNFANLEPDPGSLLSAGSFGASELVASIGYGRVLRGIHVGVAVKVIEQRLAGGRDATVAGDVGLAKTIAGVTVGVAAQNLGPGLAMGAARLALPHRITLGASLPRKAVGPFDLVGTVAVERRYDRQIIPAAGLEVSYWPIEGRTFTGRVGVRRVPDGSAGAFTVGAAFTGDEITIEYAFEEFDAAGSAHRIGLRWR